MSQAPIYLQNDDFFVDQSQPDRKVLCNYQKGVCFTLFYSVNCKHCDTLLPEFKKLLVVFPGTKFAIVNLNRSPEIIRKSVDTILPIDQVPFVVLYYNGRPVIHYQEGNTLKDMVDFLKEALPRFAQQKSFVTAPTAQTAYASNPAQQQQGGNMPATGNPQELNNNMGIPYNLICDDEKGICYFNFGELYGKEIAMQHPNAQRNMSQQQAQQMMMHPHHQQQMMMQQQQQMMPQQAQQMMPPQQQQRQAYSQQGYFPPNSGQYQQKQQPQYY